MEDDISQLNLRQTLFLNGMLKHGCKSKAARDAGFNVAGAHVEANRMLKHPIISNVLIKAKVAIIEGAMAEAKIDALWVLNQLKLLTETSLGDFVKINESNGQPYFNFKSATPEQLACIEQLDVSPGEWGTKIKVKLPNKRQVLETIGKHTDVEAFKEKIEMVGNVTIHFDAEDERA